MSKVIVCRGDYVLMGSWSDEQTAVTIDTQELKESLNIRNSKLILSIRDTIMIKALRSGRNVILVGDHSLVEQLERIEEVLNAQSQIDQTKYTWKVKDF